MVKFLLKIASLSVLSITVVIGLFLITRNTDNPQYGFLKGRFLKQERLATINAPRIILCGGSNLAFGIDSKLIQDKTGLEVINMGLQRGLGIDYMLKELKNQLKKNDIVIFSLEFGYYYQKQLDGFTPLLMLENDMKNFHYFKNKEDLHRIINFVPRFLQIKMNGSLFQSNQSENAIYHENAFNEYGDVISHLAMTESPQNPDYNVFDLEYNLKTITLINTFVTENSEIATYTVFPSFIESNYIIHQKKIKALYQFLKSESTSTVLGNVNDFIFPNSYFFDSVYHLNKKGRKVRSEKLAELINSL